MVRGRGGEAGRSACPTTSSPVFSGAGVPACLPSSRTLAPSGERFQEVCHLPPPTCHSPLAVISKSGGKRSNVTVLRKSPPGRHFTDAERRGKVVGKLKLVVMML